MKTPPTSRHIFLALSGLLVGLFPLGLHAQCSTGNATCVGSDCTSTGDVEYATGSSTGSAGSHVFSSFKEDVWTSGYKNGSVDTNTSSSFVRVGSDSIKHSIWGPDTTDSNSVTETSKRAELSDLAINFHPIKDSSGSYYYYWYGWSYYIPNDSNWTTQVNPKAGYTELWQFIGQWRFNNSSNCVTMTNCDSSVVGGSGHHLALKNGRMILTLVVDDTACATSSRLKEVDFDLGTPVKGQWMDFVVQAKWNATSSGMFKMWLQKNGGGYSEVVNYTGSTWLKKYSDSCGISTYKDANGIGLEPLAPNWQLGLYWSDDAPLSTAPRVLYSDAISMRRTLCSTSYGSEAWDEVVPVAGSLNSGSASGTATTKEMESQSYTTSDSVTNFTDATYASAGSGAKFNANAIKDYAQTGISVTTAGTYNVKLKAKKYTTRGTADLYVNNARIGSWDQYSATANDWAEKDMGNIALLAGSNTFKWVITGKNASSTSYDYTFDKLTLTPQ
jgi:hypothetical protein